METLRREVDRLNSTKVPIYVKCTNKHINFFCRCFLENFGWIKILKQSQHEMLIIKTLNYNLITITKNIPMRYEQLEVIEGSMVLSTVKGLLTNKDCLKHKIGGKLIAVLK